MKEIDIEDFKQYFKYDHLTGQFTRTQGIGKCKATSRVGCIRNGYLTIGFKYQYFLAHRLAWRLHYGEWPKNGVDHINGDKTDNRIANLRDVDQRVNTSNRHYHRDGKLVGASFWKAKNLWKSRINVGKRTYDLGYYKTEQEAHEQYLRCLNSGDIMAFVEARDNSTREKPDQGCRWIVVDGKRRMYDFVNCVYKS